MPACSSLQSATCFLCKALRRGAKHYYWLHCLGREAGGWGGRRKQCRAWLGHTTAAVKTWTKCYKAGEGGEGFSTMTAASEAASVRRREGLGSHISQRESTPLGEGPSNVMPFLPTPAETNLENPCFLLVICHSSWLGPFHFVSMNPASKLMVQPRKQISHVYLIAVNCLTLLLEINCSVGLKEQPNTPDFSTTLFDLKKKKY